MTTAQEDTLARIEHLMREHFSAGVLLVEGEHDDKSSDIRATWHGGYATSIGLLEIGKLKVWEKKADEKEEGAQ